jgi:hypothetical protein
MGIALNSVHLLCQALDQNYKIDDRGKLSILTLGVQDCYFEYDILINFLERHGFSYRKISEDQVQKNTGFNNSEVLKNMYSKNIHQNALFNVLGFNENNIESMDIMADEGAGIICDLSHPIPSSLLDRFDIIFDGGTCEHIFGFNVAIANVIAMTRVGGMVVHAVPADMIAHGLVNFSAEIFDIAYRANGFETTFLRYIFMPHLDRVAMNKYYIEYLPSELTVFLQPYFIVNVFGCFKKNEVIPFRSPVQGETSFNPAEIEHSPKTGLHIGKWNRPGTLSGAVVAFIHTHPILCMLAYAIYQLSRGKKVIL